MKRCRVLLLAIAIILVGISVYVYLYYPKQSMPTAKEVIVKTPLVDKYHNDCLHPSIKYLVDSLKYVMVQTPYYAWENRVENPVFYISDDCNFWESGILVADTPLTGFNSDPNVWVDNGCYYVFWREAYTPLCNSLKTDYVTVGVKIIGDSIGEKKIYLKNFLIDGDVEQCPILMKKNGVLYFYTAWYQYAPIRKNIGLAIWEGTTLDAPDFKLIDTIPFETVLTVDKCAQKKIGRKLFFCPKPLRHDLWHFDLFEYNDKLWMVSVAEKGDNIMLSVSEDYKHFKTFRKPLINNHYTELKFGFRQYFYKPTAFVKNDSLYLFYTANAKDDPQRNQLYLSVESIREIE